MKFDWIPVTPDTVPDKTPEATKPCYLVTILNKDGATRDTIIAEWGSVAPVPREKYKNDPFLKDCIFDDWAFGEIGPYGIEFVVKAIAWTYSPDPYMGEIARREDNHV